MLCVLECVMCVNDCVGCVFVEGLCIYMCVNMKADLGTTTECVPLYTHKHTEKKNCKRHRKLNHILPQPKRKLAAIIDYGQRLDTLI